MNKEFVTYEQALALKELGFEDFDFNLLGFFNFKGEFFDAHARGFNRMAYEDDSLLAPLKQQAFRWFREKYKLVVDWNHSHHDNFGSFIGVCIKNIHLEENIVGVYKTYEEAEQAAIDKLIEIIKNKNK